MRLASRTDQAEKCRAVGLSDGHRSHAGQAEGGGSSGHPHPTASRTDLRWKRSWEPDGRHPGSKRYIAYGCQTSHEVANRALNRSSDGATVARAAFLPADTTARSSASAVATATASTCGYRVWLKRSQGEADGHGRRPGLHCAVPPGNRRVPDRTPSRDVSRLRGGLRVEGWQPSPGLLNPRCGPTDPHCPPDVGHHRRGAASSALTVASPLYAYLPHIEEDAR